MIIPLYFYDHFSSTFCCFALKANDDELMMMNGFCGMVNQRKAFSLISSRDHCQRSSPPWISDTLRAGYEPAQNLSSGFDEWSCAVVITTIPRRHYDITVQEKIFLKNVFHLSIKQFSKNNTLILTLLKRYHISLALRFS